MYNQSRGETVEFELIQHCLYGCKQRRCNGDCEELKALRRSYKEARRAKLAEIRAAKAEAKKRKEAK